MNDFLSFPILFLHKLFIYKHLYHNNAVGYNSCRTKLRRTDGSRLPNDVKPQKLSTRYPQQSRAFTRDYHTPAIAMPIQRVTNDSSLVLYRSSLLDAQNVPHAFTSRIGGISSRPYDSLNLGLSCGLNLVPSPKPNAPEDSPDNIRENHARVFEAIGCAAHQHAWVHQVHAADSVVVDMVNAGEHPNADALISQTPGIVLSIRVADCVPILIAGQAGQVVAAIHAGWRGVVQGVVLKTIEKLSRQFNTPELELTAAVGPCIGSHHFEVGEEVADAFRRIQLHDAVLDRPGGKPHIDLTRAVVSQLTASGIRRTQIDYTNLCTFSNPEDFFSHRRDRGITGRMAAIIAVRSI